MNLGTPVTLDQIEPTLKELWEADNARTNASLINLAVYTEVPSDLEKNSAIIQEITREHACRALLLAIDRQADDTEIHSWVTAHCHLAHGQKSVCCEQLSFLLNGLTPGRMNNTLFAHLHSDLPLVLWWQGSLTSTFRDSLYTRIDRLIVDGLSWATQPNADIAQEYATLATAMEACASQSSLITQDLAWSRTWSFRTALANLFDEPLAQQALPQLTEINLTTTRESELLAQWMIAWMAHQAHWEIQSVSPQKIIFSDNAGHTFTANILLTEGEQNCCPLQKIELLSPKTTICLTRPCAEHEATHLCQELLHDGQTLIQRLAPLDPINQPGKVLARQLSRGGKNSLYLQVFPTLRALLTQS